MGREPLRFDGRVAIVTGAGAGLGRAHARLLAARGATVVVNDLAKEATGGASPAAEAAGAIEGEGGRAIAVDADVSSEAGAAQLVGSALDSFGRVDIVVNNAGLLRSGDFGETTAELFDRVLAVNLRSAFLVTRAAWPGMLERGYGRVVSTTSNSGLLGTAGSSLYAAAKAGVWGLTRCLALEGAERGVQVNAIAPLAFTAMSTQSRLAPASWRAGQPDAWGRRLDVAQVAPVVAWLAHEDCRLSGEIWSVAGGRVARFAMGLTHGYAADPLTIEQVRDCEDTLLAEVASDFPKASSDETRALHRRLMRRTSPGVGD